jgi:hypothetical protein
LLLELNCFYNDVSFYIHEVTGVDEHCIHELELELHSFCGDFSRLLMLLHVFLDLAY